jgi:hypothetical protein
MVWLVAVIIVSIVLGLVSVLMYFAPEQYPHMR